MITISLCMIVKDEEAVLARCLDSIAHVVDEIIIVDTGSADKTKEIAAKYTNLIYDFKWADDFSAARNEAFSKASCGYQMWLDADDIVPERTARELLALKQTLDPATDVVTMKYITAFDKHGDPALISTRERLLKRGAGFVWQDPIHEFIQMHGKIYHSGMEIHHKKKQRPECASKRNLSIYTKLEASDTRFTPRQLYYFARELKDHKKWAKAVYYFEKFLDTGEGWVEDNIAACYCLSFCYNALGDAEKVLPVLLKSFQYDAPRAEACSEIGYYYKRAGNYPSALKWFELAANLQKPDTMGFVLQDYWGYIPFIECCVCCCELGDYVRANEFNERAAGLKPNCAAVKHNREFLSLKID